MKTQRENEVETVRENTVNYVNVVPPADLDDSILGSHSSGSPSNTPTTSRENSQDLEQLKQE